MQTQYARQQQEVNEYFESASVYWDEIYSDHKLLPTIYQERHNTALHWIKVLGLRRDARILEIGCGSGQITVTLAENGYIVDAIDPTAAMLHITRSHAIAQRVENRIRRYQADVHALPFQSETFDLVIALGVIPWLHSETVAVREMQRVLKSGGFLVMTADNNARLNRILDPLSCPLFTPLRHAVKGLLQFLGSPLPKPGFTSKRHYPSEVDRLMHSCDLEPVRSCTLGFGPFTLFGKNVLSERAGVRLHRLLQKLASKKRWTPLRWTGSHYMVLATNGCPTPLAKA